MGMPKFEELLPLRLEDMARTPKKKRGISQKESSPAWDTRQFAAATTTPERLEPDPACVCPAPANKSDSILKASAAREAEAALLALAREVAQAGGDENDECDEGERESASDSGKGLIHRVEIEAAGLVPSYTGRAQPELVTRVHREAVQAEQAGRGFMQSAASDDSIG